MLSPSNRFAANSSCCPCFRGLLLLVVVAFAWMTTVVMAQDQPQWGEAWTRNMVSSQTDLPDTFDPGQRDYKTGDIVLPAGSGVRWTAKLGGQTCGSPVVSGGKIFVGTNNDEPRDPRIAVDYGVLMCFDEKTGEFLWQLLVPKLMKIKWSDWRYVGLSSPPSVEGDRAYLVSNRCEVMCIDTNGMADGNDGPFIDEATHRVMEGQKPIPTDEKCGDIIWNFDMNELLGVEPHNATCCSVLIDGNYLYVGTSNGVEWTHHEVLSPKSPSVIVLDKRTGRLVARDAFGIDGDVTHGQWSSLTMGVVGGEKHIYFGAGNGYLYGFKALPQPPESEEPKTDNDDIGPHGENVIQIEPLWKVNGHPLAQTQDVVPPDHQHDSSSYQVTGTPVFDDGHLFINFTQEAFHRMPEGYLACLKTDGKGDVTRSAFVWTYPEIGSSVATVAVADGLVYACDFKGKLHCLDAKTGKVQWIHDVGGPIWGSPLVADGKVYLGTGRNYFWVLKAGRNLEVISRIRMRDQVLTTPTIADGIMYIATNRHLYAVEGEK